MTHNLRYFLLALPPLILVLGLRALFDRLITCKDVTLPAVTPDRYVLSAALEAEYIWGTALALVLVLCLMFVGHCVQVIRATQPPDYAAPLYMIGIASSLILGVYLILCQRGFDNCITAAIFEPTLSGVPSGIENVGALIIVQYVLRISQFFGIATVIFAILAVCSILTVAAPAAQPSPKTPPDPDAPPAWRDLEKRSTRLRNVLYFGALALFTVLLHLQALFAIPRVLLEAVPDKTAEIAALEDLAGGLQVFWGSTLTLVLVVLFVPASLILRHRSRELAEKENPDKLPAEVDKWMTQRNLMESWPTQTAKAIALLAPLLSGPLATFGVQLAAEAI